MRYIVSRLHPDEKLIFYIETGRRWYDILLRLLLSLATAVVGLFLVAWLWVLFGLYRLPPQQSEIGLLRYQLLNFLFTALPILVLFIAVRDFVFHFMVELALTDQRVIGQMPGFFHLRHFKIPLGDVTRISERFNRLVVETKKEKTYVLWGIKKRQEFIKEFHRQQSGDPLQNRENKQQVLQELLDMGLISPKEWEMEMAQVESPPDNEKPV